MGPSDSKIPRKSPPSIAPADIRLLAWLNQAEPGDALEYHRGFLALDRSVRSPALSDDDRIALGHMASLAMRLANRGFVDLVQHRIARDCFSYIAIARSQVGELSQFLDAE